jgi:periplasmic divalent cation tolerance protein
MSVAPTETVLLVVTATDRAEAERLGEALVVRRLAACGSVVPMIHSFFWWEGRLQREHEALLLIKTTAETSAAAQATLKELHSYENPEILELPITGGSAEYLAWLAGEVRGQRDAVHDREPQNRG